MTDRRSAAALLIAANTNIGKPTTTIENDLGLIALMQQAQNEIYSGDVQEFDRAYAEAVAAQMLELAEANDCAPRDLAEELADAMRGVLLQWLGMHPCYAKRDLPAFLLHLVQQEL